MRLFLLLWVSLAIPLRAQNDFHACFGTETMIEGGQVEKLTVVNSNLMFTIRPPKGWYRQMDDASRKIMFTAPSGKSAVTIQFTTNSPGQLPPRDVLQEQAQQAHPGAGIVQCAVCPTSCQPGLFFDLVRMPDPGVLQRTRHAFVSQPAGQVEFVLSASDDEFDNYRNVIMAMLRDFRVEPLKHKRP